MEIQAKDLRLGLWFNVPRGDQSPFRVDIIEHLSENNAKVGMNVFKTPNPFKDGEFIDAHPLTWELKDLKPIELTEKVLLDCGFNDDGLLENDKFKFMVIYYDLWNIGFEEKDNYGCSEAFMKGVFYLHKLQNIFYDFTGEELNYNPK